MFNGIYIDTFQMFNTPTILKCSPVVCETPNSIKCVSDMEKKTHFFSCLNSSESAADLTTWSVLKSWDTGGQVLNEESGTWYYL